MAIDKKKRRKFIIVAILLAMLFTEVMARLLYAFRDQVIIHVLGRSSLDLDPYEMPDPDKPALWRLRPGFSQTMQQAIAAKKKSGRILKVEQLQKKKDKVDQEKIIFQINKDGFKGPEIDKTHSKIRILTLGDSCTFGTEIDYFSYPRSLERTLRDKKLKCEVINGGVEGYSPRHVLLRIEEYKALKPEMVTLYIGWNAMYGKEQFHPKDIFYYLSKYFCTYRLLRSVYHRLIKPKRSALEAYKKPKKANINDPWLKKLEGHIPPMVDEIEQIIQLLHPKSQVVLVTLPGLYTLHPPKAKALKMGHLPEFTDNPYVLAKIAIEYNKSLRKLAKKYQLVLIDLEKWSLQTLKPRAAYFTDSVHLTDQGQKMIGEYMAKELFPILSKKLK